MNYHVCIKQVPDVATLPDSGRLVLNAYDASALEAALTLRELHGGAVQVVLVGPGSAKDVILRALGMGADSAVHLLVNDERCYSQMDSHAFAEILCGYFQAATWDVILCGKQAQDTDAGLTGSMLAEMLSVPCTTNAIQLERDGERIVATRQGDTGQARIILPTPCLVTCSNDMNDPRIPTLKGTMAARTKPIEVRILTSLPESRTAIVASAAMPGRRRGELIAGPTREERVRTLVDRLYNEAKVL